MPAIAFITIGAFFGMSITHALYSFLILFGIGILSALLRNSYFGYVDPNRYQFVSRFIIEGIFYGLMLGLALLFVNYRSKPLSELLAQLIALLIMGIVFHGGYFYWQFRKYKRQLLKNEKIDQPICCDLAKFFSRSHPNHFGILMIADQQLLFYSSKNDKIIYRENLTTLHPDIYKSKFSGIPRGLTLSGIKNTKIALKFPFFWMEKLRRHDL